MTTVGGPYQSMGYMFAFNPVIGLAIDYEGIEIWNLLAIDDPDMSFNLVLAAVHDGLVQPGTRVDRLITAYVMARAWERMLARVDHVPDDKDIAFYTDFLDLTYDPMTMAVKGCSSVWRLIARLWPVERRLAFLVANQWLIHEQTGILLVKPKNAQKFEQYVKDDCSSRLEDEFIARLPGGLTDKEKREEREYHEEGSKLP